VEIAKHVPSLNRCAFGFLLRRASTMIIPYLPIRAARRFGATSVRRRWCACLKARSTAPWVSPGLLAVYALVLMLSFRPVRL
jgi:hypothetical protein